MHLFIIGAPASGKMTIGQELSRLTDATLFYNHQAIFGNDQPQPRLDCI